MFDTSFFFLAPTYLSQNFEFSKWPIRTFAECTAYPGGTYVYLTATDSSRLWGLQHATLRILITSASQWNPCIVVHRHLPNIYSPFVATIKFWKHQYHMHLLDLAWQMWQAEHTNVLWINRESFPYVYNLNLMEHTLRTPTNIIYDDIISYLNNGKMRTLSILRNTF